jgi:aldehyde:ferredoxin oxidoreductase
MSRKASKRSSATRKSASRKLKGGYHFKLLHVDLTSGEAKGLPIGESFALKYIGGRGFGAKILYDHLKKIKGPLDPSNVIIIAPGPLTGTFLPASTKTSFVSLSPQTGIYGDSSMGGNWGVELRQAGYDGLVVTGRAKELSYLWIDDDDVRVVPAPRLTGRGSLEAAGMIKGEVGDDDVKVAVIGPAGENLVRFACVNCDWSRNAGRAGMGAVMGSKNLKAVVVRGSQDLPVADIERLRRATEASLAELASHHLFKFWQEQGLMSVVDYVNSAGVLPTRNFTDGVFAGAERINGFVMEQLYKIGDAACFACPMSCGNICLVKDGRYRGTVTEGPEYETACMFGSNLGVDDFSAVLRANQTCDELGVDTISSGGLIGAMTEAVETGLLTVQDVDGLQLAWGNHEAILALVSKIAHREGVGDTLANGARAVIERWPQLDPLVLQVKGMEQSAYDGRATLSMALAYGTCDIGASHNRAWTVAKELELGSTWGLEEKADIVIYHQTVRPLFDMLGVCRLPWIELGFDENHYPEFYAAITGVEATLDDLLQKSRAIYDLTRLINCGKGISRKDDYAPRRLFELPIQSGPWAGRKIDREEYDALLDMYYDKRGWDRNGCPPPEVEAQFKESMA